MNTPPLPEIFGNYALKDFSEIAPPADISWLPQTVGWLWFGVAALAFAAYYLLGALRRWYHNRYRREAIARLQALADKSDSTELIGDINRILKITALVAYSRGAVAKLSGESWVNFLNQQCDQPPFNHQQLQLLASTVYRLAESGEQPELIQASLHWVEQHRIDRGKGTKHA